MLLIAGAGVAYFLKSRERPGGKLDTKLSGVSASVATNAPEPTQPKKRKGRYHLVDDKRCWDNFGGAWCWSSAAVRRGPTSCGCSVTFPAGMGGPDGPGGVLRGRATQAHAASAITPHTIGSSKKPA